MLDKLITIKSRLARHQFACFISLCILLAMVMTTISLDLYRKSGAIKLDMSRPGYEKVRSKVEKSRDDQPFENSGTLNKAAITDFDQRMSKHRKELKNLGNYDNANISDESLGLSSSLATP